MVILTVILIAASGGMFYAGVRSLLVQPATNVLGDRLARFDELPIGNSLAEMEMATPFVDRFLRPQLARITAAVSRRISPKQRQTAEEKLALAGHPMGVGAFFTLQAVLLITLPIPLYVLGVVLGQEGALLYLFPLAGFILGLALPNTYLDRKRKRRAQEMLLALPNAIDLMTITIEAGQSLDDALRQVIDRYDNPLTDELRQMQNRIRVGTDRQTAWRDFANRVGVDEIRSFATALLQSFELGTALTNVLRLQSDEVRRARRQRAEEKGAKASLKMLFPMVGCVFPTLFIILLGPAALLAIDAFGGK